MVSRNNEESSGTDIEENSGLLNRLEDELILTGRYTIARVHIAEEVFDGVLPMLGIILAGYISAHMQESLLVFQATLLAAVGTSIAHFVSGFGGTYLAERAEGHHLIEEMKQSKGSKMKPSLIISMEHDTTLLLSFIRGAVPSLSVLVTALPMFLALFGLIDYLTSFLASIGMGLSLLFAVGIFLGMISETNIWISALKTLLAGVLTMVLLFVVSLMTWT